ncbi:MAG: winged helix-turn-helix domain-containing protein, partial [Candidatus Bathyarchaeia archaeon]
MGRYRDRLQIVADILAITSRGAKKTQIMYQANLSYKLLCKYLDEVMTAGLVNCENGDSYVLAPKGKEFLSKY